MGFVCVLEGCIDGVGAGEGAGERVAVESDEWAVMSKEVVAQDNWGRETGKQRGEEACLSAAGRR